MFKTEKKPARLKFPLQINSLQWSSTTKKIIIHFQALTHLAIESVHSFYRVPDKWEHHNQASSFEALSIRQKTSKPEPQLALELVARTSSQDQSKSQRCSQDKYRAMLQIMHWFLVILKPPLSRRHQLFLAFSFWSSKTIRFVVILKLPFSRRDELLLSIGLWSS